MKKLGIAIKITVKGSGDPIVVNPGQWTNKITDVRSVLRHVPSLTQDPRRSVTFFFFGEQGCYIVVARGYHDRPDDNGAGWIFVPYDVQIDGTDLCDVIDSMKKVIHRTDLTSMSELQQMFSREYPLKAAALPYTASQKNGKIAKRDVSSSMPLQNILGKALFQRYYSGFEAVIIEEFPGEVLDATDLTSKPLEHLCVVTPPSSAALNGSDGAVITLYNEGTGDIFNRPCRMPAGAKIHFIAKRRGFKPLKFVFVVRADGPVVIPSGWEKINNNPVRSNVRNSSSDDSNVAQKPKGRQWDIRLQNGSRGLITVEGRDVHYGASPLKGYEADGHWLEYAGPNVWAQRAIGFFSALLLGGIVVGILAICGVFSSGSSKESGPVKGPQETEGTTVPGGNDEEGYDLQKEEELQAAAGYLDSNLQWKRPEMEGYPALKGLFNDLNSFNFSNLQSNYSDLLSKSKKLRKVIAKLNELQKVKTGVEIPPTYCKGEDVTITVQEYENWINGKLSGTPAPANVANPPVAAPANKSINKPKETVKTSTPTKKNNKENQPATSTNNKKNEGSSISTNIK